MDDPALKHVSRLPSSAFADEARRATLAYCKLKLKDDVEALSDLRAMEPAESSLTRWALWQSVKEASNVFLFYEGHQVGAFVSSLKEHVYADRISVTTLKQVNSNALITAARHFAVTELSRVNFGREADFIQSINDQWCSEAKIPHADETQPTSEAEDADILSVPKKQAAADESVSPASLTIDIFQDSNDLRNFLVIYYFVREDDIRILRESKTWIYWRRSLSDILEGTPSVVVMRKAVNYTTPKESVVAVHRKSDDTPEAPHHRAEFHLSSSEDVVRNLSKLSKDLEAFSDFIRARFEKFSKMRDALASRSTRVCYSNYLPKRLEDGSVYFKERYPGVRGLAIVGDWTNWEQKFWFTNIQGTPEWEVKIKDMPEGALYKLIIQQEDHSEMFVISPWTTFLKVSDDLVANSVLRTRPLDKSLKPLPLMNLKTTRPHIYQVHVGRCVDEERIGTYDDVRMKILPYMRALQFNTLVLVGVQEHTYYPDAGWQVDSPISVCSRFGTQDSFVDLIDAAHQLGIRVVIQFVLSHVSSGVNSISHVPDLCYRHAYGQEPTKRETHPEWDGYVVDYGSSVATEYMLSGAEYWIDKFGIDGFWFEGVPSICYNDKAVNRFFDRFKFETYFGVNCDMTGQSFLMNLTECLRDSYSALLGQKRSTVNDQTDFSPLLIANDYIEIPGVAGRISEGGMGFSHVHTTNARRVLENYQSHSLEHLVSSMDRRTSERRLSGLDTFGTNTVAKRPLRIAFFAWESLHTIAVGGIAPHVTELAAALRRNGHNVHIFTRATSENHLTKVVHGVFYHEVPFQLDRDFVKECENMCQAFINRLLWYEADSNFSFDIVHGHDWLTASSIAKLSNNQRRPTVFTMHSTESGRCGNKMFDGVSSKIRNLESLGCHSSNRVICVSGVLADEVKSLYGIHSEKIRVTYNGCNADNWEMTDSFDMSEFKTNVLNIGLMDPTILFVGRFVVQKGVDLMIEAIPSILQFRSDIKFIIVGDGHMKAEVERRAGALGVSYACRFTGSKSGAELKNLFRSCDAVIVPSRNEPFGIVVLEAWSCYKPVIATTIGGPRDFVKPFENGLLIDPNPTSIAWGVCESFKDFERLRTWGESGYRYVKQSFSWTTIGNQTKNIYFELVNLSDCGYSPYLGRNSSRPTGMAQLLIGDDLRYHMNIFDQDGDTKNGLTKLRIVTLLNHGLATDGVVFLQGSEFAHPDCVDLPRPGNNFSLANARCMSHLPFIKDLQFKHQLYFVHSMIKLLSSPQRPVTSTEDEIFVIGMYERVLQFERGDCLYIFNLDDSRSYERYEVFHRFGAERVLHTILHTDLSAYGGWDRVEESWPSEFESDAESRIVLPQLPCKFACVLSPTSERETQVKTPDIDRFIDHLL